MEDGMKKQNCWEYMKCGRQPGGKNAELRGVCPAVGDESFNGFNLGVNSGRICWLVAGTFCNDRIQGSFAEKRVSCKTCDFYQLVNSEEGTTIIPASDIEVVARTGRGLVRKTNEDRYFAKKLADGSVLLAVADGLGGEVAGDYAAELLRGKLAGVQDVPEGREEQYFRALIDAIDNTILRETEKNPELAGMGTTLVCVHLRQNHAFWVHVGDSRLYFFRTGELSQLTHDHNFARYLVNEGVITREEARAHDSRYHLDQCVGQGFCEPDTGSFDVRKDDLLILATDGLHTEITPDFMAATLRASTSIEAKAHTLIQAALAAGGRDNITLILARQLKEGKGEQGC